MVIATILVVSSLKMRVLQLAILSVLVLVAVISGDAFVTCRNGWLYSSPGALVKQLYSSSSTTRGEDNQGGKNLQTFPATVFKRSEVTLPGNHSLEIFLPGGVAEREGDVIGITYADQKYNQVANVGTLAKIAQMSEVEGRNGKMLRCKLETKGTFKIEQVKGKSKEGYLFAEVSNLDSSDAEPSPKESELKDDLVKVYYKLNELQFQLFSKQYIFPKGWKRFEQNPFLDSISPRDASYSMLDFTSLTDSQKQAVLAMGSTMERLQFLLSYLSKQIERLETDLKSFSDEDNDENQSIATRVYRKTAAAIVAVDKVGPRQAPSGQATGFLVDAARGLVVTNAHVAEPAIGVTVTFAGGAALPAQVVKTDALDLALLKLDLAGTSAAEVMPLELGSLGQAVVGAPAVAVGNQGGFDRIATAGIICGLQYSRGNLDRRPIYIISDAIINGGSSGGPLLDAEGRVIGINTFTSTQTKGLGFAVWVEHIKSLLEDYYTQEEQPISQEIWLYNDNFNKKEKVKGQLEQTFGWDSNRAEQVMLRANDRGKAFLGAFPAAAAAEKLAALLAADVQAVLRDAEGLPSSPLSPQGEEGTRVGLFLEEEEG